MLDSLAGKVAVVTGGRTGTGAAVVERLQAVGAVCHAVSRHGPVTLDVADQTAVGAFVNTLERVDILVCAAGENVKGRRLGDVTPDAWDQMLSINLSGAFYFVDAALIKLREARGHVVFISSVSAQWPDQSGPAYQASKAGLTALARAAGIEERNNGVRFSVIHPGMIATQFVSKRPVPPPPEVIDAMLQPSDVADACLFMLGMPRRANVAELTILPSRLQAIGATGVANPEVAPE